MLSIQSVDKSMFEDIYPLLLELDDKHLTKSDWSNIFNYSWRKDEEHCGYGLVDNGNFVGFLGLIFSKRVINNHIENFCNITSWIVKEEYRGKSISLILPVLKMKNYTITDMSPSREAYLVSKRLGFIEFERRIKLLLPCKLFNSPRKNKFSYIKDKLSIKKYLNNEDLDILNDHVDYKCSHLLFCKDNEYCYVIYNKIKNNMLSYCYILYTSNLKIFLKYNLIIRSELMKDGGTPFIIIDARFLKNIYLPFCFDLPFRSLKLYKSSRLMPEQVDNLYSEIVLLTLNILPSLLELRNEFLATFISRRFDIYSH